MSVRNLKFANLYTHWYLLALFILFLDQLIKMIIEQFIQLHDAVSVVPFFNIVHFKNKGAAFGFLANAGGWQQYFFISIAFTVSCWLVWAIRDTSSRLVAFAYSMILGGAFSNLIDRVFRGSVVDFLDIYWRGYHWPAFNLADATILIGVCGVIMSLNSSRDSE